MRYLSSLILLAAFGLAGCEKKDAGPPPRATPEQPSKGRTDKGDKIPDKADISIDANAWYVDFKKDGPAAAKKYQGKVVELSGMVATVSPTTWCVYLKVENPGKNELGVPCVFEPKARWPMVSVGSKVKVRGKVFVENVRPPDGSVSPIGGALNPCTLVEAGPDPGPKFTSVQFAKEFAANRKDITEKYDGKWAYVEGEVTEKTSSQDCEVLLKLKGFEGITMSCCTNRLSLRENFLDPVGVGKTVTVYGVLSLSDDANQKEILLNASCLVEVK
jgi:hypothetical protein